MIEIGNTLDGTVEKAVIASEKLNGLPKILQKLALAGDFSLGNAQRIDVSSYKTGSKELRNYIAQISALDKKQRDLVMSMSNIESSQNIIINSALKRISIGDDLNGVIVEQILKENDFSKAAVEGLTAINGLKDANGKYGIAVTSQTIPAMETWINEHTTAIDVTKMLNDNIITGTEGNYQFTDSFKDLIIQKQKDVAVTKQLTTEQMFWNAALQIGKQLLVSFAIGAFIAAIQKFIQAWKDYRNQFVDGMNDAHDAAEKAKADVDSIQAKIDELNEKVKAAGANKISDIVDPAERAKLEAINENLEKQLKLKKQLQETEEKKEHENAVGVYNTKDETIYKDIDGNYDYTMGMAPDTAGYKATDTEALGYYSEMLDKYTEKYNKLLETTTDENDPKLRLVKEQMDYAADEVSRLSNGLVELQGHLSENSDEYNNITNVLGTATDALSYYNGDINVSNSKLTELTDKIKELDSASKSYYDTVTTNQKYQKYGNVDNTNRGVIRWNEENLQKYSQFAEENGVTEGSYSTVLGTANEFNNVGEIAYTPMLQTENGVVPLTSSEIDGYINDVIQKASKMDGGATPENILKVDAEGITETVAGETTKVQGMIAAVEGQIKDGVALTAADVAAISGRSAQELQDEFGEVSKYVGYSMHDIQKSVEEMGDGTAGAIARIQQQVPNLNKNILAQMLMTEGTGFTEETQKGFEVLYEQMNALGFDVTAENCKLFAAALERLGYISDTTADQLAKVAENKDKLEEATTGLKNIQTAYSTLSSVVDEYNKNGYLTVSTLSSLIDLGPEYYDCLVDESGQLAINTENINTMADAYYEMAKAALYAQAIESLNSNTNTYANASKFLEQAQQEVKDMKSLLYAEGQRLIDEGGLSGDALATQVKAQERIINTYSAMIELLDKTHAQSTENQFRDPKDKSSSNSSKKNTTDPVSAWKTMSAAMEEYNQQGALCVSTLTSLMNLEDEYTSLLDVKNGKMELSTSEFKNLMLAEIAQANASDDSGKSAAEFKKVLEWVDGNVKENTISYWQLVAAIEGYSAALEKAKGITDTFKDAWSNGKTVKEKQEKSRAGALDYEGTEAQSSALQDLMKYSKYDPELISKAFNKETGMIDLSGDMLKNAVAKSLKQQAAAARTEGGEAAEAIAASYEKSAENIENDVISVQDYFDGLGSTIEEVSSKIDDVQSAFTDLDDIKGEYDTYGALSVDSLQKLLTMSPDYIACLEMEGDQLIFNRDKMVELLIVQLKLKKEFLLSKEETKNQAEIIQKIIDALRKDGVNALAGMNYQAEKFKSAISDAKDILSSFLSLLSSANDKSNNDLKIWGDTMNKVIDKRIKALNKQKEALEENNDATERAIELSKAQDALARAQQQRTTRVYTENGYEWQANAEDVRTAREDLADKQREWNKKDAEKAIDDQIKKYNEFKDKLSEVMDDIGKSWKDYQKELEYTAQIQKMSLSQMEGSLDSYHNKIIASLNTGSAITSIQNLIANLESLINTLTKVNNLYSMLKTSEYKDLGTKGLWNTIKGFFNKGGEEATGESANVVENFFNVLRSKVQTSGNGLIETFGGIWEKIKLGAQRLFNGSGEGGGIVSTVVNGFKTIGGAVKNSKIGSAIISGGGKILGGLGNVGSAIVGGGGKLLAGAGKLIGTAGNALAAAGPAAIPIAGAAALGIYGGTKAMKNQKKIWSNKEDGFGKKALKSVASFFWDISPIGTVVNLCKDIFGKSKETAENTKDTANSSSETAENTKNQQSVTNLTINATQVVSKEENKVTDATDATDKKNDTTGNEDQTTADEDKTIKTAATTLAGAGTGAAIGMALGGPVGAGIGALLGSFAGFLFGRHANGLKSSKTNHLANVDERGSELIVRQPASGRYTYLETGDGVVPADITSRLFEMGGNPDKWFSDQLAKHSSASMVQSRDAGGISLSIGDVNVNNPVGDSDALARELVNRLPNKVVQELNRR